MANENSSQLVNILLSRDELLLVLTLLEAQYIPGLDIDPLGERSAEQQDLAFVVAARGLRARDLARVRARFPGWPARSTCRLVSGGERLCLFQQRSLRLSLAEPGRDSVTRLRPRARWLLRRPYARGRRAASFHHVAVKRASSRSGSSCLPPCGRASDRLRRTLRAWQRLCTTSPVGRARKPGSGKDSAEFRSNVRRSRHRPD